MGNLNGTRIGNLILQNLQIEQADRFFEHIQENRDAYIDTIPFVSRATDHAALVKIMARNILRQAAWISDLYTLWNDERMAGYFLVREKDPDAHWAEIGYMIGKDWQGKGIAKTICDLLISDLFKNQGMQKVVICCNDDNLASIGLAKKLGFHQEGNLRNHFVVNGKLRNMLYFGLLKTEWDDLCSASLPRGTEK